jgi:hypothetical protein
MRSGPARGGGGLFHIDRWFPMQRCWQVALAMR